MRAFIVLAACFVACLAFDIPEPFSWDESFKVFYEQLDEQHKGLFKAIFELDGKPGEATALSNLATVIRDHFTFEEGMMKTANYPELTAHQKLHEDFKADLAKITLPVSGERIHFAKDWLVNHIKGTDFKYKGKL